MLARIFPAYGGGEVGWKQTLTTWLLQLVAIIAILAVAAIFGMSMRNWIVFVCVVVAVLLVGSLWLGRYSGSGGRD